MKKHRLLKTILVLAILFLVVLPAGNVIVYEVLFSRIVPESSDFQPVSESVPVAIPRDGGRPPIDGSLFADPEANGSRALIVLSPGIRSTYSSYAPLIDALVQSGLSVLAYNYGDSGSVKVSGLPEAARDINDVLNYLKTSSLSDMPLILMGHSLGAYASGAVLPEHPEVDGAILISPFDRSSDMLKQSAERYIGPLVHLFLPYVRIWERIKFGRFSDASVTDGALSSDCPVVILFGSEDSVITAPYGYEKLVKSLSSDPETSIERLENQGHTFDASDKIFRLLLSLTDEMLR
ncbi:MAG: alpha/beta fold hydrolase [Lachnospiraceae bacterium]|nr:alpha/beta fold hydrolase [Lachnospiraceae bacterium]